MSDVDGAVPPSPLPDATGLPAADGAGIDQATPAYGWRPPLRRVVFGFVLDVLIAAALFFLLAFAAGAAIVLYRIATAVPDPAALDENMPSLVVASLFATLLAAVLLWAIRGRRFPGEAAERTAMPALPAYGLAIAGGVAIQAACFAYSVAVDWLGTPTDPSNVAPLLVIEQAYPVVTWLFVVLLAPFGEELMFRHVFLRRFAVAGRALGGLVTTSILFALIHETTPWVSGWFTWLTTVAMYTAMGLGFGAIYLRTRRLGAAFAAHATCNLLAMLMLAFSPS